MSHNHLNTPYKGLAKIGSKVYKCHVVDGIRYIDGKTVDEFIKTLSPELIVEMFFAGVEAIKKEKAQLKGTDDK